MVLFGKTIWTKFSFLHILLPYRSPIISKRTIMIFICYFSRYDFKCKLKHKAIQKVVKWVYVWCHNYLAKRSHIFIRISWNSWHFNYMNITTFFKTDFVGGHSICWGQLFLGHAVDVCLRLLTACLMLVMSTMFCGNI